MTHDRCTRPVRPPALERFIRALPKAELHVHHVGSASTRIVSELATRHPGPVPSDLDELRQFYEFRDFAHFIEVYLAVVALIRTPEDIHYLTYEIAREMATEQRLRYAELTCTPYTSVRPDPARDFAGMSIEAYTEAIEAARVEAERDFGLVLRWIYDIPGEFGVAGRRRDDRLRPRPPTDGLIGFGLGGRRSAWPGPSSSPTSIGRGRPGCTPCRTPARPPGRRPCGTRSPSCTPSGSATAPRPPRTPPC